MVCYTILIRRNTWNTITHNFFLDDDMQTKMELIQDKSVSHFLYVVFWNGSVQHERQRLVCILFIFTISLKWLTIYNDWHYYKNFEICMKALFFFLYKCNKFALALKLPEIPIIDVWMDTVIDKCNKCFLFTWYTGATTWYLCHEDIKYTIYCKLLEWLLFSWYTFGNKIR